MSSSLPLSKEGEEGIGGIEEIEYKPRSSANSDYKPYTPAVVKMLSIAQGFSLPLLAPESGGPKPANARYTLEKSGLVVNATLKLACADGSSDAVIETPLAMCAYVKPDGDSIYDVSTCIQATSANMSRVAHNTFLVDVLNEFVRLNGMGTSGNKLTCPDPPPDAVKLRTEAIKALTSDKLSTTRKAVNYLKQFELYCGRDYEFDDAFDKANDVCFREVCRKRAEAAQRPGGRKIRVTLEGCPPSAWDGKSPTDSAGHYVAWSTGAAHTFLTPNVTIVRIPDPPRPVDTTLPLIEDDDKELKSVVVMPTTTTARKSGFDSLPTKQ
jgi:hypothetical protein